jgi:hypothetical protein
MESRPTAELVIIDDFGLQKPQLTAAHLLEIVLSPCQRAIVPRTSNRRLGERGKPAL